MERTSSDAVRWIVAVLAAVDRCCAGAAQVAADGSGPFRVNGLGND
jgi:hypothetical protein